MAETYEIVAQRQTTDLGPAGRFEDVMEVTFRSKRDGTVGIIRVPLRQLTPANVDAIISAYVADIDAIADL